MKSRWIQVAVAILSIPVLLQCASTSKAPAEQSEAAKTFEATSDKGVVYIYRKSRMMGAAGSTQIQVNGKDAGGTGPGTFFKFELNPGKYVFSARTEEASAAVEINVEAGEVYYVQQGERIGVSSGRVAMDLRDDVKGQADIAPLELLVSTYVPEE